MVKPLETSRVTSALILVDLQEGISDGPFITPVEDVAARAAELADAFREAQLPIVVLTFTRGTEEQGSNAQDPLPPLQVQPSDLKFSRSTWGAFAGTELDATLREAGVGRIVVAGVATSVGVESIIREAHDLNYEIVVPSDAVTDLRADTHSNSMQRIFPMIAGVSTTRRVVDVVRPR